MLKFIKSLLIINILIIIFSVSASAAPKCELNLNNLNDYKSSLISCLDKDIKEFDKKLLNDLSDDKTNFFSEKSLNKEKLVVNQKLILSEKFDEYLKKTVNKNYLNIYGIHQELNILKTNYNISNNKLDKLISNSLVEFLDTSIKNQNGKSGLDKNTLAGLLTVGVVLSALDSEKEEEKLVFSLSSGSSDEDAGETITLTATTRQAVTSDTTVNLSFGGTALKGTDYSFSQNYITISSGSDTGSHNFTITDDSTYEGNETIIITSSTISGDTEYENASASTTFTINENESAPTVTLTSSASSVAENGSALTLTATLSGTTSEDVTISLSTSGTGTEGTDYSNISDITISAGDTTGTTSFTPTDDSIYEGSETGIVSIDTVSGGSATENGTQAVTITITDNESAPTVTLTSSASSIAENSGSSLTLTATLSGTTSEDVTVSLSTSGTGTEGTDYGTVSDITISSGSTTGTATFTPTDDNTYEGNETGIIAIDTVSGGSATENGTQAVTLTITDNESAPTVTLSSSASNVSEDGSALTLTATLSNATTEDVTVTLSASGTATEGTDYANLSNITVSAGDTTGTTALTPTDDTTFEGDETITIDIDSVSGGSASESGTQQVSITLEEDDAGPTLTISDVTTSDESAANAEVTVTLSPASGLSATVDYETSNGTATAGADYTSTSGTLTFDAGDTSKTINVPILADTTDENNETITLTLSNAVRATIEDSSSTITITDDDSAPSLSVNDISADEDASSGTFTVSLSAASGKDITVDYTTSDGTATAGSDYTATSGTLTISAGDSSGTVPVTITDESIYEGNETVTLTLSSASNASISDSTGTLTITEDESAPVITIVSTASSVYDNGSDLTLTAQSTQAADENITVTLSTSGTASSSSDYALSSSTITILANETSGTATFNPTADTSNEGAETATISIAVSGANSSTGTPSSVTITINEYALRTQTSFTEGSTASQNSIKAETQWTNVDASSNDVHPYELMNIHKVQSFSDGTDNLTGKGEYIHIADFNCDDNHLVYSNKTIVNLDDGGAGESTFDNANSSNYHCQFVASMAAGDGTGNGDGAGENLVSGVAPDADLILSSIPNYSGNRGDDWARDLDSARSYGAVASNNSWGFTDSTDGNANANVNIAEAQADITTNGWTNIQGLAYLFHSSTNSQSVTDAQLYIDALDNFQNNGVIVFSNGNYNGESDASVMAGLPEFFSQLEEAWITVNWSDFTGSDLSSATESDFTLHGNKCGQAAEYCLTADGTNLMGGGYIVGDTHYYPDGYSGSSFSAPMVSGGIALLAQAFPNHTPEQLTDRVFASANNSWFTPEGNVTFTSHGNSIVHGYHTTWGHGVPDFYAALSPITTDSNPASFITASSLAEGYRNQSERFTLSNSSLAVSSMIGSGLVDNIKGTSAYFYDALGGGFEYDLSNIVYSKSDTSSQALTMNDELAHLRNFENEINLSALPKYYSGEYFNFKNENDEGLSFTITTPSVAMQKLKLNQSKNYNDDDFTNLKGLGINNTFGFEDYEFTLSLLDTSLDPILIDQDHAQSLVGSLSLFTDTDDKNLTLSTGHIIEKDTLLFSKGSSGLNLGNEDTNSNIFGANYEKIINDNHIISLNALFSKTEAKKFNNSLISGTDKIISSKFDVNYSINNIFDKNNSIQFSVSQPTFVEQGSMNFKLPGLADTDGNIPFTEETISLKPSARQLDYQIGYYSQFNEFVKFGLKASVGQNQNHDPNASLSKDIMSSIFINF